MVKGFGGAALAAALAGTVLGSGPAAAQAPAQGAFSGNVVKIG
ncbi:MAG: ABC transporter permease, partial [Actinomycetospora chiangmaiensis]|nr:ABC transporter permease [Actinomycetospora chiangmaiensis]